MARDRCDGDPAPMYPLRMVPGRQLISVLAMVGVGLLAGPPALASGGGGLAVRPALQRDWPSAVPIPAGTITGTSGLRPSETVALLARGSAAQVSRTIVTLYTSHGFKQAANGAQVFSSRTYRVTVILRSHDHSASRTDVAVWLQTR